MPMSRPIKDLHPGQSITPDMIITPARVKYWTYAHNCGDIGGGLMPGASLEIVEIGHSHDWIKVAIPGAYPPRFLQLTGAEIAHLFSLR